MVTPLLLYVEYMALGRRFPAEIKEGASLNFGVFMYRVYYNYADNKNVSAQCGPLPFWYWEGRMRPRSDITLSDVGIVNDGQVIYIPNPDETMVKIEWDGPSEYFSIPLTSSPLEVKKQFALRTGIPVEEQIVSHSILSLDEAKPLPAVLFNPGNQTLRINVTTPLKIQIQDDGSITSKHVSAKTTFAELQRVFGKEILLNGASVTSPTQTLEQLGISDKSALSVQIPSSSPESTTATANEPTPESSTDLTKETILTSTTKTSSNQASSTVWWIGVIITLLLAIGTWWLFFKHA